MNSKIIVSVVITLAAATAFGQQSPSRARADIREIQRLEVEWNTINEVSDAEGKARLLAEDSYHVGPSGRLYNKAQDIEATRISYNQKQASGSKVKFFVTGMKIRLNGDVAVVTATGRSETTRDATQRFGGAFRAIHVWESGMAVGK